MEEYYLTCAKAFQKAMLPINCMNTTSLILGLGLCSQLLKLCPAPFYQITLVRTPGLISDRVIQLKTYCSRKDFEEEWEEIPSFKSPYVWKAVNVDRIQNGGSHF